MSFVYSYLFLLAWILQIKWYLLLKETILFLLVIGILYQGGMKHQVQKVAKFKIVYQNNTKLEKKMATTCRSHQHTATRYAPCISTMRCRCADDSFTILPHGQESLMVLLDEMNSASNQPSESLSRGPETPSHSSTQEYNWQEMLGHWFSHQTNRFSSKFSSPKLSFPSP